MLLTCTQIIIRSMIEYLCGRLSILSQFTSFLVEWAHFLKLETVKAGGWEADAISEVRIVDIFSTPIPTSGMLVKGPSQGPVGLPWQRFICLNPYYC